MNKYIHILLYTLREVQSFNEIDVYYLTYFFSNLLIMVITKCQKITLIIPYL